MINTIIIISSKQEDIIEDEEKETTRQASNRKGRKGERPEQIEGSKLFHQIIRYTLLLYLHYYYYYFIIIFLEALARQMKLGIESRILLF